MILKLLLIAAVLAVFLLIYIATRPAKFSVVRSATINASPAVVFAQVNDLHNWSAWSPWAKLDPTMKETHGGPPAGTGATYHWLGNKKVGEGHMTITDSRPGELVQIRLEFIKPFAATNQTEFTFQPTGNHTTVSWTMTGRNNFVAKAFCMFMNMDKMVGGDFERGLASLKHVAESPKGSLAG